MRARPCREWLTEPADRTVLRGPGGDVSLRVLARRVSAACGVVSASGAARVAIDARDAGEFLVALLAVLHAGRTPVLRGSHRLDSPALTGAFDAVASFGDPASPVPVMRLSPGAESGRALPGIPADAELILFTSGSTGIPKAVRKPVSAMDAEARMTAEVFGARVRGLEVAATVDPMHMFGLTFAVWLPMASGLALRIPRIEVPESLANLSAPSALITTPSFLRYLELAPESVPPLRFVLTAGGALPWETAQKLHRWAGVWPDEIYGSTETGVVGTRHLDREGEQARLFPGISFGPRASEGEIITPLCEPPRFMLDDRLELTGPGTFRVLGRKDRVVKIAEHRVSLTGIERAVRECCGLSGAALPVTRSSRVVVGFVFEAPALPDVRALRRALRSRLPAHAVPRLWRFTPAFPADSQGKRDTMRLLELFDE